MKKHAQTSNHNGRGKDLVSAPALFARMLIDRTKPIGDQIVLGIIEMVRNGSLHPGERLPAIRALADGLHVNRNTVAKAYQEVAERGYLRTRRGGGSVVTRPVPRPMVPDRAMSLDGAVTAGEPPGAARFSASDWMRRFAQRLEPIESATAGLPAVEGDAINLFQLRPHTGLFPMERFRNCLNAALRRSGRSLLNYGAPSGYLPLREQIASRLNAQGVRFGAGEILITSGSQQGIDLVARAFLDPGDGVVVESPMYSIARKIFVVNGARLLPYAIAPEGAQVGALEGIPNRAAKLFYAVPNFQNPTTHTYTLEERRSLLDQVYRSGGVLVEDALGHELHADPTAYPPLAALDGAERVIYLNTFSKSLIPAVRAGYLAGPAAVVRKLTELKEMTDLSHSLIMQAAIAEFMERGYFDEHVAAVGKFYRSRMAMVIELLTRELPRAVRFSDPGGGLCVWIDLPTHVDTDSLSRRLAGHNVLVSPAGLYDPLQGGRNGFRLCVSHESEPRLAEGIRIIGRELERMLRQPVPTPAEREYQAMH